MKNRITKKKRMNKRIQELVMAIKLVNLVEWLEKDDDDIKYLERKRTKKKNKKWVIARMHT